MSKEKDPGSTPPPTGESLRAMPPSAQDQLVVALVKQADMAGALEMEVIDLRDRLDQETDNRTFLESRIEEMNEHRVHLVTEIEQLKARNRQAYGDMASLVESRDYAMHGLRLALTLLKMEVDRSDPRIQEVQDMADMLGIGNTRRLLPAKLDPVTISPGPAATTPAAEPPAPSSPDKAKGDVVVAFPTRRQAESPPAAADPPKADDGPGRTEQD